MECSRSGAVEAIGRVRLVRRKSRGAPPGLPRVSSSVRNRPTVAGRPSSRFATDAGVRLCRQRCGKIRELAVVVGGGSAYMAARVLQSNVHAVNQRRGK